MTNRAPIVAILICLGGRIEAQGRHWAETPTETIWRGRYTNCDKGWAVDLPPGIVAHGDLPPNPNHGFLISLFNPGTTASVTPDTPRIVDIYDEYDALGLGNAQAYMDRELKDAGNQKPLELHETTLKGLRGVYARYRAGEGESAPILASLIFVRLGVVYHLLLRTTEQSYGKDSALFLRIRAGFRLLPFPKGECVNP